MIPHPAGAPSCRYDIALTLTFAETKVSNEITSTSAYAKQNKYVMNDVVA